MSVKECSNAKERETVESEWIRKIGRHNKAYNNHYNNVYKRNVLYYIIIIFQIILFHLLRIFKYNFRVGNFKR